ncbi:MAG TPA: GDSL-type esterase/lipase family protein [Vicinamibacterales bacterium]
MRFHQPVARLLTAGVALAVALAATELIVRIAWPQNVAGSWLRDSGTGYDLNRPLTTAVHTFGPRRVTYRFNELGLRGAPANASTRILALGDSITFGWLLEERDTYVAQLDDSLKQQFGSERIALLNAAVGGWGTGEYLAYLEEHGEQSRPDAVVVFFSGAELRRAHTSGLWRISQGTLERVTPVRSGATRTLRTLSDFSFYRWLSNRSHLITMAKTAAAGAPAAPPQVGSGGNVLEERDRLHDALVRRLVSWCRDRDIPIWFVATGLLRLDGGASDGAPFLAGLQSIAAELSVPYVDLRSELYPRLTPGASYVIPVDLHPNEAAAGIVVELTRPWLAQRVAELLGAPSHAGR